MDSFQEPHEKATLEDIMEAHESKNKPETNKEVRERVLKERENQDPNELVTVSVPKHEEDGEGEEEVVMHKQVQELLHRSAEYYAPQQSEEWLEQRTKYVTASTAGSVLGENQYETRNQALRKKLLELTGERWKPHKGARVAMSHGNHYESAARRLYEVFMDCRVVECGLIPCKRDEHHFLGASPDGFVAKDNRLIEIKCPYRRIPNGTVPQHYMSQIQFMLSVFDLEVCHYVEFVPQHIIPFSRTFTFDIIEVRRDHEWDEYAIPKLKEFFDDYQRLSTNLHLLELNNDDPDQDGALANKRELDRRERDVSSKAPKRTVSLDYVDDDDDDDDDNDKNDDSQ